jgi:hypothetical protein
MSILVLVACIGHGYWIRHRIADTMAQTMKAQGPAQELAALNGQISALEAQLRQLEKKRPSPVDNDYGGSLIHHKKMIPALFEAMSHLVCDDRVITRIRSEDRGSMTIEGLCLDCGCAQSLAVGLERELGKSGWDIPGAQTTARLTNPDGGPWEFKVTLLPAGYLSQPATPPVAGAVVKAKIAAGGAK